MLVVLVLIGLLAGIVTVSVRGYLIKGKQQAAEAQIASFKDALESYYTIHSRFPSNEQGLKALTKTSNEMPQPLMEAIPKDPWGNSYQYNYPGRNGRAYEIISYGADGREGGEGSNRDVVSWRVSKEGDNPS
jgi:general secretion pathway protein G